MLFGKYRLIRKLATGGMAEIFLARQEGMEGFRKDVVIKRILPIHADNDELINMFLDEARIAAELNHPNIVQIYELGKFEDDFFIVMEFVHGQDLRRTCERGLAVGNFLPLRHAVRTLADAAAGLHYAHTQVDSSGAALNIVHRDISPQNVLVSFDGVVKILDFGIAKAENKIVHTRTGQLKGKYAYMSPEQCNGLEVDARSDIFALGTLLYEMTLCRRLFKGDTDIQTIKRVSDAQVTPPTEVQPEYPADLEEIVMKALAKDPDDRFQSAREFQMALEDFLSDNRMKTGTLQIGEYMREIFPDKLDRPGEDPTFVKQYGNSLSGKNKAVAPPPAQAESSSADASPAGQTPNASGRPPGPPGGPPGRRPGPPGRPPGPPGGPPGRPPGPPGRPPGPPGRPPGPSGGPPAAPTEAPNAGVVSFVVNPNAPYSVENVAEHKPKRRKVSSSDRSSVKSVEYDLSANERGELDTFERRSRQYYLMLAIVILPILAYAVYKIVPNLIFAGDDLLSAAPTDNVDPDVPPAPPPPPLPRVLVGVTSTPPAAAVVVNGVLQSGETPGDFNVVPGQLNTVSVYLKGHQPLHRNVQIPANGTPEALDLKLELLEAFPVEVEEEDPDAKPRRPKRKAKPEMKVPVGKVTFTTDPPGGEVFLDGRSVGVAPVTVEEVSAFVEHHVTVRKEGFYDHVLTRVTFPDIENPIGPIQLLSKSTDTSDGERVTEFRVETIPRQALIYVNQERAGGMTLFKVMERNQLLRVKVIADDQKNYKPWERVYETTARAIHINPQAEKINRAPGKLTLKVSPPGTKIYVGPNEEETVDKYEVPGGDCVVSLENPDGVRGEFKIEIIPGRLVEYKVDFSGDAPKVTKTR